MPRKPAAKSTRAVKLEEPVPPKPPSSGKLLTVEEQRMAEPAGGPIPAWRMWGPYVSERSWGTVREDYSASGDAWNFLSHDHSRSKAYRWGEDGIAGYCDRYQLLCFALAFWNGKDPILKERMFGLNSSEGNHGEDVKEYWFYLDNTPSHSYQKMLYKYPQEEFPYRQLIDENARRQGGGLEYELLDTGVFDEDRYFDVVIEYAKQDAENTVMRIEIFNRGPEDAPIHLIPHLWFRNTWGWTKPRGPEPTIRPGVAGHGYSVLAADDSAAAELPDLPFAYSVGKRYLYGPAGAELLFTGNETNGPKVWGEGAVSAKAYTKDAFHRYIVNGEDCCNPEQADTKACMNYKFMVPAGGSQVVHMRLANKDLSPLSPLRDVDAIIAARKQEADDFYASVHPPRATEEEKMIQRQAFAGMLWGKQIYIFDVSRWLEGDDRSDPPPASRKTIRNAHWRHLHSMRVLSVPDKWEYPWFAAWDLAFHCNTLALVDPDFAKHNLWVMVFEQFQHPNGQIPAYEWEFSDLNPPVHAWAAWKVYNIEKERTGVGDLGFLEKVFHKLLINFAWWVNKVDSAGNNVFEGGFLGLDNITVVDRSAPLAGGAVLEQSDATGWMGFFCLDLMRIALELAKFNKVYEGLAVKFFEHFVYIGAAMNRSVGRGYQLWDEKDGFFYDVLRYPSGEFHKFRVRSLVGLIPMYAIEALEEADLSSNPEFLMAVDWFIRERPDLTHGCYTASTHDEKNKRHVLAILDQSQLEKLLIRMWDPDEFLSPGGIRSLSKFHEQHPFVFAGKSVQYDPAEAVEKIKGGNSNWRGPIWFPTSYLLIESMLKFGQSMGPDFGISVGGGAKVTPAQMAEEVANRMIGLFKRNAKGERPIYGGDRKFQDDPHWRDLILFHEYFHGDNGAGLGATHQTGWTGLVASLIHDWRK